jgi:hypothetical protein
MIPTPPENTRSRGSAVREARLIRTRMIRRRVIAGALSLFVATWLLITLMLVSGHDPALAARTRSGAAGASTATPAVAAASTSSAGTTSGSTSSAGTTSGSTSSAGTTSGSASSPGTTSAVTTQQS